jgi:hypothetical protein
MSAIETVSRYKIGRNFFFGGKSKQIFSDFWGFVLKIVATNEGLVGDRKSKIIKKSKKFVFFRVVNLNRVFLDPKKRKNTCFFECTKKWSIVKAFFRLLKTQNSLKNEKLMDLKAIKSKEFIKFSKAD